MVVTMNLRLEDMADSGCATRAVAAASMAVAAAVEESGPEGASGMVRMASALMLAAEMRSVSTHTGSAHARTERSVSLRLSCEIEGDAW